MKEEISGIVNNLLRQLNHFWNVEKIDHDSMLQWVKTAVEKVNISFGASNNKYFLDKGFCTYNSAQYCVFLYYLSNIIGRAGETELADKVYYLNKIMNSVDLYWAIELPRHFIVEHPLGCVMGRAQYGDYVLFSANCLVKDENIPSYSIVFGSSPNLIIKGYDREMIEKYFSPLWKELK